MWPFPPKKKALPAPTTGALYTYRGPPEFKGMLIMRMGADVAGQMMSNVAGSWQTKTFEGGETRQCFVFSEDSVYMSRKVDSYGNVIEYRELLIHAGSYLSIQ